MNSREIDALVAKKVMGLDRCSSSFMSGLCFEGRKVLCNKCKKEIPLYYTRDIGSAWQVVDKLRESFEAVDILNGVGGIVCELRYNIFEKADFSCEEESPSKAICFAALKAVGVEIGA